MLNSVDTLSPIEGDTEFIHHLTQRGVKLLQKNKVTRAVFLFPRKDYLQHTGSMGFGTNLTQRVTFGKSTLWDIGH